MVASGLPAKYTVAVGVKPPVEFTVNVIGPVFWVALAGLSEVMPRVTVSVKGSDNAPKLVLTKTL